MSRGVQKAGGGGGDLGGRLSEECDEGNAS